MKFRDYFSKLSSGYAKFRPLYPREFFKFINNICTEKYNALDIATGSGQAATGLIDYFFNVIAIDASKDQIFNAIQKSKINYLAGNAELLPFKSGSVDLVTIAQALHWFNFNIFYKEVKRVLNSKGIIAAWCYGLLTINEKLDTTIKKLYYEILKDYWPDGRNHIDNEYNSIPFPFKEIMCPSFNMSLNWDLKFLIGYLNTWSAVQKYKDLNHNNPIEIILPELIKEWGNPKSRKEIIWPIFLKAGKK